MTRILVTGAGGFIGRALCPALLARGHIVVAGLRRRTALLPPGAEPRILGDIVAGREWGRELDGIDVVVHLAQRAHRRASAGRFAGEAEAAAALARGAARAGVRRLAYLSSINAMAAATAPGRQVHADDPPCPAGAYGRGKLASEQALAAAVAAAGGPELVVLRPPLVYGPGAGGNFRALARLAARGLPLPFAAIDNRRSLIFVGNLADLVAAAATHPAAAGRVLLAADGVDLSTPALIRLLAAGQGRRACLFAVPPAALAALRALPGLAAMLRPLTLSLRLDDSATRAALGWSPPFPAEAALLATARALGQAA